MNQPSIEPFIDELSDEALDAPRQPPGACCGAPGCQGLCPVFPSMPDRIDTE